MGVEKITIGEKIQLLADYVVSDDYNMKSTEFNTLVSLVLPNIKGYIQSISNNYDIVDDLTSETVEAMCKYIKSYKNDHKFITWSYGIARNKLRNHIKIEKKSTFIPIDNMLFDVDDNNDSEKTKIDESLFYTNNKIYLDKYVHDDYKSDDVKSKLIGNLYSTLMNIEESDDKDIFIHKEINNILVTDIAEFYNISPNTVKTKLYNFKGKLKKILKSDFKKNNYVLSDVI